MHRPLISIIIPTLNQADYLERTLCSVLDQGYSPHEIIVMDGGSDDATVEIVKMYQEEVAHWRCSWDDGPADAINQALGKATGRIVSVLGGDDLLLPHALERVAQAMCGGENASAWVACDAVRIDSGDTRLGLLSAEAPDALDTFLAMDRGLLTGSANFYRRELIDHHGGFDTSRRYAHHLELHARLIAAGQSPTVIANPLVAVRERADGRGATHVFEAGLECVEVAESMAELLDVEPRLRLWRSCDERRRIYALARTESAESAQHALLWRQLLRRPQWLASARYRRSLLRDGLAVDSKATPAPLRLAA